MEYRDNQKECIDIVNALPDGSRSVVALATGLGKTFVSAHFNFNGRLLWLSHRDELVRQPEHYFTEQGFSYGIEKAEQHENGETVVSASVQSLFRDERLKSFDPDAFDMIICDEAHHAAAPSYRKILSYFKPRKLIGLTATPKRGDGIRLTDVFDNICYARDLKWGIDNGWLSRIRCLQVHADFDMDEVEKTGGDFTATSLDKAMSASNQDMVVAKAYVDYCLSEKRKTLIYCPTLNVCRMVLGTIREMLAEEEKESVQMLSQETGEDERKSILERYTNGTVNCIINCMILTEGTDLPDTSAIICDRPSANPSLYQQIIGRGTRLAEGKEYCLVIDVVGDNAKYKSICTAPTLFGLDPDLLSDKMKSEMQEMDLLEFTSGILQERAKTAKAMELQMELIDLFAGEREEIIGKGKSPLEIAAGYKNYLEDNSRNVNLGINHGDILIHLRPEEKMRYEIHATFDGRIRLAQPDILGNTVMDVDIPGNGFEPLQFISPEIPIDKAMSLTEDILKYVVPGFYATQWSLSARKEMDGTSSTGKQDRYVKTFAKSMHFGSVPKSLTKLQASDIISLGKEMESLNNQKRCLSQATEDAGKKRRGKNLEKWLEKQEAAEKAEQESVKSKKENYEPCLKRIESTVKLAKMREESFLHEQTFKLGMDYSYYRTDPKPSDKQISFLCSLWQQAERMHIKFNDGWTPYVLDLDMWHTGFVINYFLYIVRYILIPHGKEIHFDLNGYISEIDKIKMSDYMPETITCNYKVCSPGTAFTYEPMPSERKAGAIKQREGEGTAEELYQRIQEAKQRKEKHEGQKPELGRYEKILARAEELIPEDYPVLPMPKGLHRGCSIRIEILNSEKKNKNKFNDYVILKTGGQDAFSRMTAKKASEIIGSDDAFKKCLKIYDGDEKRAIRALRWYMRGLNLKDAVRKIVTDDQVAENAMW